MKQVAFIDPTGQVAYVTSPGTDDMYVDGQMYGDLLAKDIPADADGTLYIREKYWHNNQWNTRIPRPGDYYTWSNYQWNFDQERFDNTVRNTRDALLKQSDWTALFDVPLSPEKRGEWKIYRQALRDIMYNTVGLTDINDVPWPARPA